MLLLISRNSSENLPLSKSTPMIDGFGLGAGFPPSVSLVTGNKPPHDGVYACIVKIFDYWRLSKKRCKEAGVPHFSESIDPEIIHDAVIRRAILVFDLSNEGPEFQSQLFDEIHEFADGKMIPRDRIVWLAQNRSIEKEYYKYYGTNKSNSVGFEYYDFFVKLIAHWFADAQWRQSRIGDMSAYAESLLDPTIKTHLALCLNATSRRHRILALAQLEYMGLINECLISFGGVDYPKGHLLNPTSYIYELRDSQTYNYLIASAEKILKGGRIQIDRFAETGNQLVDKIDKSHYWNTFFSIVTETDFSDGSISRVTEKLVKICCLGHPFVVLGNPNSLRYIERWGFQSFADIIDQKYDNVSAPDTRFTLLFEHICELREAIHSDPKSWLLKTGEISKFNIQHAGAGFLTSYSQREERALISSLDKRLSNNY